MFFFVRKHCSGTTRASCLRNVPRCVGVSHYIADHLVFLRKTVSGDIEINPSDDLHDDVDHVIVLGLTLYEYYCTPQ